jgi:hypothetical protein
MDSTPTPAPDELQFDTAEVAESSAGPLTCHVCQRRLFKVYFEVSGHPACERCRYDLESERSRGSGVGRFARAVLGGGFAGAVGAGIYYAVLALTGYEIGLVAIVVGFLVGFGVRWGSRGRGGWPYQLLAVGITYVAIVSTYVPFVIEEIQKMDPAELAETAPAPPADEATALGPAGESTPTVVPTSTGAPESAPETVEMSGAEVAVALAAFGVLMLALPFLGGFENIIGLLIIGFGLYQAWVINRRQPLVIEGPFQVGRIDPAHAKAPDGANDAS